MRQLKRRFRGRPAKAYLLPAAVLMTLMAGCSEQPEKPTGPATTPPASAATTPVAARWESQFSSGQLDVYRQALSRWTSYKGAIQPHNAAGRATAEAKRVYQEYVIPWQVYFQRLERNESNDVRIARQARVLESRATRIVVDPAGSSVTIEECVDASDIGATQNGAPVASAVDGPQVSTVIMSEVEGRWMVSDVPDATEVRPCSA